MKKSRKISLLAICILLAAIFSVYSLPKLRAAVFVKLYHEQIEEALSHGHGVPAEDAVIFGYDAVNSWDGTYPMTEFILQSRGDTYYGCYYSPEDVPLAFQNTPVILRPDAGDAWQWQAEGNNRGSTSKITDCWYFFEASF